MDIDLPSNEGDDYCQRVRRQLVGNDPALTRLKIRHPDDYDEYDYPDEKFYFPTSEDWVMEGEIIANNTQLKKLEVIDQDFVLHETVKQEDLGEFFGALFRNRSIQTLSFDGFHLSNVLLESLGPFFEENHCFGSLLIDECPLEAGCLPSLQSALARFKTLRNFQFSCSPFVAGLGDKVDTTVLTRTLATHPQLKSIKLSGNPLVSDACIALASLIRSSSSNLRALALPKSSINDEGMIIFASAIAESKSLKKLDLDSNTKTTEVGWGALIAILQNRQSTLERISMGNSSINNSNVRNLLQTNVKALDLSRCLKITTGGWESLFQYLRSPDCTLEDLCLSGNEFGDDMALSIAESLVSNNTLHCLDLSRNTGIGETGLAAIATALVVTDSTLRKLDLASNPPTNMGPDNLAIFATLLGHNKTLTELVLYELDPWKLHAVTPWSMFLHALCNTSSIADTYSSNHSIKRIIGYDSQPQELLEYFDLNQFSDKHEVARQKILRTHFSGDDINLQPFIEIDVGCLPHAIAWMAKECASSISGATDVGHSLLFTFLRVMPALVKGGVTPEK